VPTQHLRNVTWIGGPQDGGVVAVDANATWVAVLENNKHPSIGPSDQPALVRYSVPIIDGKILWAQRVLAKPEPGDL
jgi:hypothetical protein